MSSLASSPNNNQQEQYISFDQLEPFQPYLNYVQLLREASNGVVDSATEQDQLAVIYLLRRMRKYERALFDVTFENVLSRFVEKFLSKGHLQSPVLNQSLFFINEIFSEFSFDFNDGWLEQLYPPVEDLVFNSNEKVGQLALMVVKSFAVNMKYNTTIEVLFNSLLEAQDSESKCKFVYEMFELFFTTIDKINLVYGFDWNEILQNLSFGNDKSCNRVQGVLLLLKKVLDSKWGEFTSSLTDANQILVKQMTACNSFNN